MNSIYGLVESLAFSTMVCWEIAKRYAIAIKYTGAKLIVDNDKDRKAIWGKSAPSLENPPIPLNRPISQRIVQAWMVSEDESPRECLQEFRKFIDEKNQLSRKDVFHNSLSAFEKNSGNQKLVVVYKNGMRTFSVVYKDDIVFPPSTPSKSTAATQKNFTAILNYQNPEHTEEATQLVQTLSGPCRDFYVGSTYETTVKDVIIYRRLVSSSQCHDEDPIINLTLTTDEGLYMTFDDNASLSDLQ